MRKRKWLYVGIGSFTITLGLLLTLILPAIDPRLNIFKFNIQQERDEPLDPLGDDPILTSVDPISPYIVESSPKTITATSTGITPDSVTLFYRYSNDNTTWEKLKKAVEDNTINKDSSADKGTETSFANAQETAPDTDYMTIQENNSNWQHIHDVVDDNTPDKDSTADKGTETSFANCQDQFPDTDVMTLQEANQGWSGGNENKNVNGLDTAVGWSATGSTPYLSAQDYSTNYISASKNTNSGWFTFADTTSTHDVSCTVQVNAWAGKSASITCYWDLNGDGTFDGSQIINVGTGTTTYYPVTVGTITYTQANALRMYFRSGATTTTYYIDHAYANFVWSASYDYELDMEYQFNSVSTSYTYNQVSLYLTGSVGENLLVDYYNAGWTNLGTINAIGWSNFTATGLSSTYNIRIRDADQSGETTQHSWTIDVLKIHSWNDANYKIDFEYNWTTANYNGTNTLCFYVPSITGSETLNINYWNGASWTALGTITATGWTNVTATGSVNKYYTIQLIGATETGDTEQGSWNIDCIFLHTDPSWTKWNDATNPDTVAPYSWNFNFPDSYGYYEFVSIGKKSSTADEVFPTTKDALCQYSLPIEEWQVISSSINGSIRNVTVFKIFSDTINGTIRNVTVFKIFSDTINGSICNLTIFHEFDNHISGSIYNTSSFKEIDSHISGTIYNFSGVFKEIQQLNGSIYNLTIFHEFDNHISGSIYNLSGYFKEIQQINGSISNLTQFYEIDTHVSGSIYNLTIFYEFDNHISGSIYNITGTYREIQQLNGSIFNFTQFYEIDTHINGSIYSLYIVEWTQIDSKNGTIYNYSAFHEIFSGNGSITNITSFTIIDNHINGVIYGYFVRVWEVIGSLNGSIYNVSIGINIYNEYPENNSITAPVNPTLHISIIDSFGYPMNVYYYGSDNLGSSWFLLDSDTGVTNGTYYKAFGNASTVGKTYFWKVISDDGHGNWYNVTYSFTPIQSMSGLILPGGNNNMLYIGVIVGCAITGLLCLFFVKRRRQYYDDDYDHYRY